MKDIKVFLASSSKYIFSSTVLNDNAKKLKIIIDALNFIYGQPGNDQIIKSVNFINQLVRQEELSKFLDILNSIPSTDNCDLNGVFDHVKTICTDYTQKQWQRQAPIIKSQLNRICDYIRNYQNKSYRVVIDCWWEIEELKSEGELIASLKAIANSHNIGIFMFGDDILIDNKKNCRDTKQKKRCIPNSNVLIELGMFSGLRKKTFIMAEEGSITPSDVAGLKSISINRPFDCIDGFVSTINSYIEECNNKTSNSDDYAQARLYYNSNLSNRFVAYHGETEKYKYVQLETKALYIGTKSAYFWEKIENSDHYIGNYITKFLDINRSTFNDLKIDNIISFGPGVGNIDSKLMSALPSDCYYIPVDLNASLAIKSRERILGQGRMVPLSIIDDFEDRGCFARLKTLIDRIIVNEIGPKNLFSMLGVTFSNLSMNCADFFNGMTELMDDDDYLLLDVMIYENNVSVDELISRTNERISNKLNWDLIGNAIKKKGLSKREKLPFNEMINSRKLSCSRSNKEKHYTTVNKTVVLDVSFESGKSQESKNTLFIAKYYNFNEFKKYIIHHGFEIVLCHQDKENKRGVFLIKKENVTQQ